MGRPGYTTEYVEYNPSQITSGNNIETIFTTMNDTNFPNYVNDGKTLKSVSARIGELDESIVNLGRTGAVADLTLDGGLGLTTDSAKATWDTINNEKYVLDETNSRVVKATAPSTTEDATWDFKYAAGCPTMLQIDNNGPSESGTLWTVGQPYLAARDIFTLHNVMVTRIEQNTLGEDSEYFSYTAVVDLTSFLYNGENVNNCIYAGEFQDIENYTALVSLSQLSADMTSINKITRTLYDNEIATVVFNTTFPTGTININSILFIKTNRNNLPDTYTSGDFLESANSAYINTELSGGFNTQLGIVFTAFNGTGTNAVIGNSDYIGIKYDSTNDVWNWVFNYNGVETVYTNSNVSLSTFYYIDIADDGTDKNVFINGNKIFSVTKGTSASTQIYLFANNNSGSSANHSTMKLYNLKIFSESTKLLSGDYVLCTDSSSVAGIYNLSNKSFKSKSGSTGTITLGYEPEIEEYILTGNGVPTSATKGNINQFYKVKGTDTYYMCLGYQSGVGYVWVQTLLGMVYE